MSASMPNYGFNYARVECSSLETTFATERKVDLYQSKARFLPLLSTMSPTVMRTRKVVVMG